jgi:diguanylate cyclase (GGDEF)-like protein/PAS domain S-box-containing protein
MYRVKHIVLIQSESADARSVHDALASASVSYKVQWLKTLAEGVVHVTGEDKRSLLRTDGIAAILIDLFLPDSVGIETFDRLIQAAPQIPILVLVDARHEDLARLAVERGAQDYLLKDRLDAYVLPKALGSMVERAAYAEALFEEKERAQVTLDSIGDAVVSTDMHCTVTYLNAVAEVLTGWSRHEAEGRSLEEVFPIIDATTREPVSNPMALAMRENKTVCLAPNCILVRRDGVEAAIEDSAAPIHDRRGRVTGAVMVFHDVSTTRALSLRMSFLAQHDSLTDLPNRALLNDRLGQGLALAHRHRKKLALLFLDIDRFKNINDSLGHDIGDRLLKAVAQRLLGCVRGSDTVSRVGGDEFVILLSEVAHAEDAAVCAEKVLLTLSAPHCIEQHNLQLTASIGIVTYPEDGTDAKALLKHADFAMYHAKECGRNNFQFFQPEMNARALERRSLENGLRHAIPRGEFVLHYQPILNLQTGVISGAEALIRWNHPHRGLVPPTQFIPSAEESGFIVPIGEWVLREACRQTRRWEDAGLPRLRMAVNVSTVELRDKNFVARLLAVLQETGVEPGCLELELTETFLMQDSASTAVVLRALKETGVQLALDDFGTGYSSLSHLRHFPIDTLKIDQGFVRNLASNADDASIVSALISMGRNLRMRVVAEGVETPEQTAFLQMQQCPEAQGFWFSPAVTAEAFSKLSAGSLVAGFGADVLPSGEAPFGHKIAVDPRRGRKAAIRRPSRG